MVRQTVRMSRTFWLALWLGSLLTPAAAFADDDRLPKLSPPAQAPSPAPAASESVRQPQQGWPSLQSLLQLPDWMSLDLSVTAEPMAGLNPALNPAGSAAWIQQIVISSTLGPGINSEVESWREVDHWRVNLQLSSFNGDPNLNLALGTAFPLQTAAHPVGLWLTEASVERDRGNASLGFKAGLLALNPSFIENPSLDSYIHSALNNTLNLLIPGLPINPFVAPGGELRWHPSPGQELRLAGYWLDSQTSLASMLGVDPVQPNVQGSLQIVQWSLSNLPGSQSVANPISSRQGLIARQLPAPLLQLGAFSTTASSNLYPQGDNQGVYGSLALPAPLPIGLDNRLWVSLSSGFNSAANPYPLFVAGGWLNQGLVPGRPFDVLAVGFGRTSFSPQLSPGTFEAVLELNYAISINAQLSVQPVLQWIINPGGSDAEKGGAFAGGLQLTLSL